MGSYLLNSGGSTEPHQFRLRPPSRSGRVRRPPGEIAQRDNDLWPGPRHGFSTIDARPLMTSPCPRFERRSAPGCWSSRRTLWSWRLTCALGEQAFYTAAAAVPATW